MSIEIVNWNLRVYWDPRSFARHGGLLRWLSCRRINNFGDLLGPLVVSRLLESRGAPGKELAMSAKRLLTVGSIMHFARDEDVVWGSGVNGAVQSDYHRFSRLDVRAVRGPLTRDFLQGRSIEVPEVYGDPALLLPHVMPELVELSEHKRHEITIVPNFLEMDRFRAYGKDVLDPRGAIRSCLSRIAQSEFVIASSLHAVIVAEALGIPARVLSTDAQPSFKYRDYYMGTGRETTEPAGTIEEARRRGGERPLSWSSTPLLEAFPYDLWGLEEKSN